jgi:hypothetical protein
MLLMVMLMCLTTVGFAQDETPKPVHAPRVLPGVEPEMLTPEYWIAIQDDPDEIIMTPEEIVAFNADVRIRSVVFRDQFGKPDPMINNFSGKMRLGLYMNPILPLDLPATIPGDSLIAWMDDSAEIISERGYFDNRNAPYSDVMKQAVLDRMDRATVPNTIQRRWGLIVERADVRIYPTATPGFSETKWELDYFQITSVHTLEPVAILHESVDGEYYYVQTPIARGWIAAKCIAVGDRDTVRGYVDDPGFLMAIGDRVPIYGDPGHTHFIQYLYYSARLPLKSRATSGYVVRLPYRAFDGSLAETDAYISADADVHEGRLVFTKRNVLTQIFKLLDQPYGWADQQGKRDCSGTQRVTLKCFGIVTGRWPNFLFLAAQPENITTIDSDLTTEEKIAQVRKIEPVITWAGSGGHAIMLLGEGANGKLYYLHQAGWGYDEADGRHCFVNRVSINEATHKFYSIDRVSTYATFRP